MRLAKYEALIFMKTVCAGRFEGVIGTSNVQDMKSLLTQERRHRLNATGGNVISGGLAGVLVSQLSSVY